MKHIKKLALGLLLIAFSIVLSYWLFPGDVIAVRVETKVPLTTKQIIAEVFQEHSSAAISIATCESGLDPTKENPDDIKLNGYISRGLFQISEINGVLENWKDPRINTIAAKEMFERRGWIPWKNCAKSLDLL